MDRLRKNGFPDYSTFNCNVETYTYLTAALQNIVNEIAPMKDIRVKENSKPWFDSNIMDVIRLRDKLNERFLRTKLHINHERFKEQLNLAQQKIKKIIVRNQRQKNTKKPMELWKVFKNIGLASKIAQISKICLKETMSHNLMTNKTQTLFKIFTQSLHQI